MPFSGCYSTECSIRMRMSIPDVTSRPYVPTNIMKFVLLFSVLLWAAPSTSIPGGIEKINDLESEEVLAVAGAVVDRLNELSNSLYKTVLVKVTEGTVQIVAGKKYVLTLEVGTSTACRKDDATTEICPVSGDSQLETWTAVVVYHPWYSPQYEILSLKRETPATQQGHHHSTDKVGAPVPLEDVHDEYVLAAAEVVITELNERSNSLFETILVKVLHGTAQVVNGVKYKLTLLVGVSQCRKDGKVSTLEECPVQLSTEEMWQAVVWQHPTLPPEYDLLELDRVV